MVLRMTGAREPSPALSDTELVGHVCLPGQLTMKVVTEDRVFRGSLFAFWFELFVFIPKKKENGRDYLCCYCFKENINYKGIPK